MARVCADHLNGYRVWYLLPDSVGGAGLLSSARRGHPIPPGSKILAVPYTAKHDWSGEVRYEEWLKTGTGELPPGALGFTPDADMGWRLTDQSLEQGTPDAGYAPIAPDALLGTLRGRHQSLSALARMKLAVVRAELASALDEIDTSSPNPLAKTFVVDPLVSQIKTETRESQRRSNPHLSTTTSALHALRHLSNALNPDERAEVVAAFDTISEHETASILNVTLDDVAAVVDRARAALNASSGAGYQQHRDVGRVPVNLIGVWEERELAEQSAAIDAKVRAGDGDGDGDENIELTGPRGGQLAAALAVALEARPDVIIPRASLTLVSDGGFLEYNDSFWEPTEPDPLGFFATSEEAAILVADRGVLLELEDHEHSVIRNPLTDSGWDRDSRWASVVDTIHLTVPLDVSPDAPVSLEHGCAYLLWVPSLDEHEPRNGGDLSTPHLEAAFPTLAAAEAALAAREEASAPLDSFKRAFTKPYSELTEEDKRANPTFDGYIYPLAGWHWAHILTGSHWRAATVERPAADEYGLVPSPVAVITIVTVTAS